ncbi:SDR family oxidoreductase [Prochlorococcus marinus]|uniref:SDR family oxidoreductase n=1 Tax=Prochlorococcus marinus TaxID=1219 RepID=UPI0022B50638|nr:SDR family oxidoreductase [Prochlorococcus marinus]
MTNYLITGSNRGLGLEFCRQLNSERNKIVAICRSTSSELADLGVQVESGIDLTTYESIYKLRNKLSDFKIDIMIHNAGLLERDSFPNINKESVLRQFNINAISPLILTKVFLKNLSNTGKIILISSRMGSIADNSHSDFYGYRMSKSALCMAGKSLSIDLRARGIAVALLHPGMVNTQNRSIPKALTPELSVRELIKKINLLNLEDTGKFWHVNGEIISW